VRDARAFALHSCSKTSRGYQRRFFEGVFASQRLMESRRTSPERAQQRRHPRRDRIVLSSEDQRTAYPGHEVFARFASKIDLGKAPEDLLRAINRERARRG